MLRNTETAYGSVAKIIHWLVALVVIGLFSVGVWMVTLDYYSDWYKTAPHYHKSVGLLLAALMIFRLLWRWFNVTPKAPANHTKWERFAAHSAHILLYLLLFALFFSGFLISTADGRGIEIFNWVTVPSLGELFQNQEDIAGEIHEWLAYSLIALVVIHAAAALKHHFIDKDNTLKRMINDNASE